MASRVDARMGLAALGLLAAAGVAGGFAVIRRRQG